MTVKVIVYHEMFDCDTGCCGHMVELQGAGGEKNGKFEFRHPYGDDPRQFAEDLVRRMFGEDHVKDLDWEHCIIEED